MPGFTYVPPSVGATVESGEITDGAVTNAKVNTSAGITWGKMDQTKFGAFSTTPVSRPAAYTQTYSTAARTHAAGALNEALSLTLVTEVVSALNTTNATTNELKKVVNQLIDDLQTFGLLQ